MSVRSKKILYGAALLGYMSLIFYLSSQSKPLPFLEGFEKTHLDWVLHSVEYAILGFLLHRCLFVFFEHQRSAAHVLVVWALVIGSLYGLSDEWHQGFTPLRDPSFADWVADTLGVWVGATIFTG